MAKTSNGNDIKSKTLARIKRTEAYAERVRTLFAATVNEILALNKSMPELEDGEMFSFDATNIKKQREVERILRQLHSIATMAIQSGIKLEWAQANAECDKLVQSYFGKRALNTPEFTAWTQRNEAAMSAFIARSEHGLNLSQRVWKSCRQLRDEMEVAITVAVGDGTSAASMSRNVRKYLNDPDLMFRRFRYRDPVTGEWKRKWKKRVIGEDGKVHFIDYDKETYQDDWTGPGYYKSSAQNAMRVARTETNIAYRRADNARWQQMDFVLGQRVHLSRSHPKKDICDKLAGDYPKEFVFDGWHPQCFCYVTPILIDEDEMAKEQDAFLRGEEYTPRGKRITQYPENFKQWVSENADNIAAARERGTEPYFIRNNGAAIDNILNPKKQLTPLEIAEQRHANRTPEQEEAIRLKWQERQERIAAEKAAAEAERLRIERINKTAQNVLKVATTRFADFGLDTVALEAAVQSGDTEIINAETRALAQAMAKKQQQIKQTASNIIGVASNWQQVSTAKLEEAIKSQNLSLINAETRKLATSIVAMRNRENALKLHIPDAHKLHETFKIEELETAFNKINETMQRWPIDINSEASLIAAKKGLEHEVVWMGTKGTKYVTWQVSQSAYQRQLDLVNHRIDMLAVKRSISAAISTLNASRSTVSKQLVSDFDVLFANDMCDISVLKLKAQEITAKANQLETARQRRAAKKTSASSSAGTSSFTPKSDAETKKEFVDFCKTNGIRIDEKDVVVDNGFVHLQNEQHRRIYEALRPETDNERKQLWNHQFRGQRWGASGYIQTGNSFVINKDFRQLRLYGKIDAAAVARLQKNGATTDDIKTIKLLDKKISEFSLPVPIRVTRYVGLKALDSILGVPFTGKTLPALKKEVSAFCGKQAQADPAYMSASTNEWQNVFYSQHDVKLVIEVPPNTPMYLSSNYQESEVVLGRATKYELLYVEVEDMTQWGRKYTHLTLHCRIVK